MIIRRDSGDGARVTIIRIACRSSDGGLFLKLSTHVYPDKAHSS